MKAVVDTNVAIAANGRNTHASPHCQLKCIEFLQEIINPRKGNTLVLDLPGYILDEYRIHLNYRGQPGVGDLFFKFLHDNLYSTERVIQVAISPIADETRGFEELPPNKLDPGDRKFLATSIVGAANLFNALDTDWSEQVELTKELGVEVVELCP